MKKGLKKLVLSRETLRQLNENGAGLVNGGGGSARICPNYDDPGGGTGPVWTGPFYAGCPSYGNYCTVGC